MNTQPRPNAPDENEIESMLRRFKPEPSPRFHQRMQTAPWHRSRHAHGPNREGRWLSPPRLVWGLVIVLVVSLLGAVILIPPVRAIARQIIYSFISAPSNQIEIQATLSSPGDLFNYTDPSNFTLSLDEAQSLAGFQVRQILPIPAGLTLVGARYDPDYHALTILYRDAHFSLFLTQRTLGNSQDVFSIGQAATVEVVKIGVIQAEYVQGGWKAISTQPAPENQARGNLINITATWDSTLPQSTLRWQAGGIAYEIRAVGEGGPTQSDLINWANELK